MPAPLVSVVMPARNAAAFLREAIDSILTQTWRELELIVVDDGSTDDTRAIAEELGAADGRLRVISPGGSQNAKSGLVAALNRGFSEARGDLVARMDADDLAYPDRIAQQVAYLDANPKTAVVGAAMRYLGPAGPMPKVLAHPVRPDEVRFALDEYCCIAHPSVVVRRRAFIDAGGYRASFLHAEDYDLWLRLVERHDLANLPDPLVSHRMHPDQVSFAQIPQQVISSLFAVRSAISRRTGEADPAIGRDVISRRDLIDMGMAPADLDRAIVNAYVFRANLLIELGFDDQAGRIAGEINRLPIEDSVRESLRAEASWLLGKLDVRRGRYLPALGKIVAACWARPAFAAHFLRALARGGTSSPIRNG